MWFELESWSGFARAFLEAPPRLLTGIVRSTEAQLRAQLTKPSEVDGRPENHTHRFQLFNNAARVLFIGNKPALAIALGEQLRSTFRATASMERDTTENLAMLRMAVGDWKQALADWEERFKNFLVEPQRMRGMLCRGHILSLQGHYPEASELFRGVLELGTKDTTDFMLFARIRLAALLHARGIPDAAEDQLQFACIDARTTNHPEGMASALAQLALLARTRGDTSRFEELLKESMQSSNSEMNPPSHASRLFLLSSLHVQRKDYEQAALAHAAGVQQWKRSSLPELTVEALEAQAAIAARTERYTLAARCLARSERLREQLPMPLPYVRRNERARVESVVREQLSADRFAWEYEAGTAANPETLLT